MATGKKKTADYLSVIILKKIFQTELLGVSFFKLLGLDESDSENGGENKDDDGDFLCLSG